MYYVDIKDFDDKFNLKEDIDNDFLSVKTFDEHYYIVEYDFKLYKRFKKMLKISYHPNIKKYVTIIKYSIKYDVGIEEVIIRNMSEDLAKEIDKDILKNLFNLKNKNTI